MAVSVSDLSEPRTVGEKRAKPTASTLDEVSGPLRPVFQRLRAAAELALLTAVASWTSVDRPKVGWSWRFWPTPGRSCITGMQYFSSSAFGPTPDSIRI